uniref:damage-control phosphatase ARMT1 family protein n=1 Tax=Acetatifactor sp. TaxID=1872090 RepID=UPI004055BC3E
MIANSMCISCFVSRQEKMIRNFTDEHKKSEYMHRVLEIMYKYGQTESAPCIAERINVLYRSFWGNLDDFTPIKQKYNQLLLGKEAEMEKKIRASADGIKECIKYVCAANYIDFSAVKDVNVNTFEKLLTKAEAESVPEAEYAAFCKDLEAAEKLVYLTDNCGEIVLDKLFIKFIKERYPKLQITVIVRGEKVINDATMEDAKEVGLTELVPCIGNGNAAPGTVLKRLSEEAKKTLEAADVIISKGQGNFESLYGEKLNPYFMFLCKCELFVRRFGLEQYSSVFMKEERM